MLTLGFQESFSSSIQLLDMDYDTMYCIVYYLYSRKLRVPLELDRIVRLYTALDKYGFDQTMQNHVLKVYGRELNCNAFWVRFEEDALIDALIERLRAFQKQHWQELMKSEPFKMKIEEAFEPRMAANLLSVLQISK